MKIIKSISCFFKGIFKFILAIIILVFILFSYFPFIIFTAIMSLGGEDYWENRLFNFYTKLLNSLHQL